MLVSEGHGTLLAMTEDLIGTQVPIRRIIEPEEAIAALASSKTSS